MGKGDKTASYLSSLIKERPADIKEIENYAHKHHVPIMEADGLETMLQFLRIHNPVRILEIGTAIGYSAIRMLQAAPDAFIYTVERDEERIQEALKNARSVGVHKRFNLVQGDALEVKEEIAEKAPYDVLFIDAAKGQYENFFSIYEPMVKEGGLIFSDNVLFKGFVSGEKEPESRRLSSMVNKLRKFNDKLMKDPRFDSVLLPVGDGLMVNVKRNMGKEIQEGEKA
ncbi:O-methyltransferase [Salipaludibacillus aurantiacus]|uniref:tRNA 5-hydroxyuridine methyltransferase n=1 Tax=Salipaludibacillus aurantiacus TaxID=1601833 RepID=A0A1H9RIB0_9BACI|nr:O-methyltransferase [Salipaludibacillus aurantiacus]SER72434.1 Predicted O-methyltransferase YrrM [Salipaludibacillus aurantiacus]